MNLQILSTFEIGEMIQLIVVGNKSEENRCMSVNNDDEACGGWRLCRSPPNANGLQNPETRTPFATSFPGA